MVEKFPVPQVEKLVGNFEDFNSEFYNDSFSREKSQKAGDVIKDPKEVLRRLFEEYATKPVEGHELEKTERDYEIINLATEAVKHMSSEYGRESFVELTPEHIHFFPDGGTKEATKGQLHVGSHSTVLGEVFVDRRDDVRTAITTFHELWHMLASYQAVQVTLDGKLDWYRAGFSIKSRDGKKEMFHHFDEGLVGYATKRFVDEVLRQSPDFSHQIESYEAQHGKVDTTRQHEFYDICKLAAGIMERNEGTYTNMEDVFDIFMKAQVTGNLIPVARLLDRTFGKGTFRKLSGY